MLIEPLAKRLCAWWRRTFNHEGPRLWTGFPIMHGLMQMNGWTQQQMLDWQRERNRRRRERWDAGELDW